MTDETKTNPTPGQDDFDDASEIFPRKEDFEDRLVFIWVTGKQGTRIGTAPPHKTYGWVETVTMALDNGQDGTKGVGKASDGEEFLIGQAPAVADPFQWSAEGMFTRLAPRIRLKNEDGTPNYAPLLGRINRRKNVKKGMNDSWSISKPTDADKEIARKYLDQMRAQTAEIKELREGAENASAFDE